MINLLLDIMSIALWGGHMFGQKVFFTAHVLLNMELLSGRGNDIKIVTMLYHASFPDLAP